MSMKVLTSIETGMHCVCVFVCVQEMMGDGGAPCSIGGQMKHTVHQTSPTAVVQTYTHTHRFYFHLLIQKKKSLFPLFSAADMFK